MAGQFGALPTTATTLLQGETVLLAPHSDDEALGCGGLLAQAPDPSRIHIIYAADGSASHAYLAPSGIQVRGELVEIRKAEARCAAAVFGISHSNLHFLDLPDGALLSQQARLCEALAALLAVLRPQTILLPFRYDRHPDHIAVYRAGIEAARAAALLEAATFYEYFIYPEWRELPGGDVRAYLDAAALLALAIDPAAEVKRAALACYASQFTCYFPWQARPVVPTPLLERSLSQPELFHRCDPARPGMAAVERWRPLVAGAIALHRLAPALKRIRHGL
ncbi:MAG: PIG-L family deacetylase [Aggregatilineales bacterium]